MEDSRICSCSECQENFLSNKHSQKWELSLKLEVTAEFQRREFHKFLGILGKAESIHSKLKALNICSNIFQRFALLGELIFNLQLNGSLIHSQNVVVPICTLISNLRFGNIQHQLHCVVVFWLPGLHWQLGSIIRSGYCDINLIKDGCQVFCAVCS